jgi:hypothetical protein
MLNMEMTAYWLRVVAGHGQHRVLRRGAVAGRWFDLYVGDWGGPLFVICVVKTVTPARYDRTNRHLLDGEIHRSSRYFVAKREGYKRTVNGKRVYEPAKLFLCRASEVLALKPEDRKGDFKVEFIVDYTPGKYYATTLGSLIHSATQLAAKEEKDNK